jgi:V/A-type H+-transporting ATPase subunit A
LREDLLQQSSFDDLDASCPPARLLAMVRVIREAGAAMSSAHQRGVAITDITSAGVLTELGAMRRWLPDDVDDSATRLSRQIVAEMSSL